MAQNVVLRAAGLHTFQNYLGSIPDGALIEALNVVIDRNNIIEPRRGFNDYGTSFLTSTDRAKQKFNYKNRVLRHVGSDLQFDSDNEGTFLNFTGSLDEIEVGLRVKGIEANSNFYFVSSEGIKKISAVTAADFPSLAIESAGAPKALDVTASPNYSTGSGFLPSRTLITDPSYQVAYRIVWGITDNNENLLLGSPSNRVVVENVSLTTSCNVDLSFTIPADVVNTNYFYQIYRTGVFPGDPGLEMYLVFEDFVTSAEITAGEVNVTDITPEDFRRNGALLYINPQSGEGIAQANEKPPFAKDIALYKGYVFYGNTSTIQRLDLSVISIENLVSEVSEITVTDGTTSTTYRFRGTIETYTADLSGGGLTKADFVAGAGMPGYYFNINSSSDEREYYIWFRDTTEVDPFVSGRLGIMVDISTSVTVTDIRDALDLAINSSTDDFNTTPIAGPSLTIANANNGDVTTVGLPGPTDNLYTNIVDFSITSDGAGTGEDALAVPPRIFLPRVPTGSENGPSTAQQIEQMALSMVRIINKADALIYAQYVSDSNSVPGLINLYARDPVGSAFFLTASSTSVGEQFSPALPTSGSSVISSNEVRGNRIYYSKYQQPEAVPLVNYIDIGPKDKVIKRIVAIRDSLFIFKEDGIYRLSGDIAPFQVAPFDFSVQVLAADSAVVLNNQIYALSTQGVITVTDTGVSVISRPIENLLLNVTREGYDYKAATFGVSYESDRAYHLWTVTNPIDEVATQCFRFNTFTNSWTRWNIPATCGIVNFNDDRMYLGSGNSNLTLKERKSLTRTDFADKSFEATILADSVNDTLLELGTVAGIEAGDRIIQTQYLTISTYNRLLLRLDLDPLVADTNYFATLEFLPGQNVRTKIEDLATKLDADSGLSFTNYFALIDDYTQTITSTTTGSQTVINFVSNDIQNNRWVSISGSDTTPSIDGTHQVVARTGTSITIDFATTVAGTMGTVQTIVQDFRDAQACFNLIVANLNNDAGAFYANYATSTGSTGFESIVLEVDVTENTITIKDPIQLYEGAITVFKSYNCKVIWAPQYFQDPSLYKQVREGTVIFENSNYTEATVGYSTELSPFFETITFPGSGDGDFGSFSFGDLNFGGIGAAYPFRTLIPRQKQRCRYMNVSFEHQIALEKFSLYGISLTFRPYSVRAYK